MKPYKIPILWESIKTFDVMAENLQEAANKAASIFMSIPDENYILDSMEIDDIVEEYEEDFDLDLVYRELNSSSVTKNKEIKVYTIDIDELDDVGIPSDWSNEKFMYYAEKYGDVYTLKEFEIAFNNGDINEINTYIKLI